jgi:tRNA pseudouridine55 synthase
MDGVLVIDKPGGMTSRDAVNRAQRWFPPRTRVGHTGTLDPLATGVLVLCLGQATRLTEYVQQMPKTYRSTFRLGAMSDTDDADGLVQDTDSPRIPNMEELKTAMSSFVGCVQQRPPAYSAAKVGGRRAYDLARRGQEVNLATRSVNIYAITLLSYVWPFAEVTVHCGKGTYIRSLARDLGERLECGALVQTLRRTRVGPFTEESALALTTDRRQVDLALLPSSWAVHGMAQVIVPCMAVEALRQGKAIAGNETYSSGTEVAVLDERGLLVAVTRFDQGRLRPEKVLPT